MVKCKIITWVKLGQTYWCFPSAMQINMWMEVLFRAVSLVVKGILFDNITYNWKGSPEAMQYWQWSGMRFHPSTGGLKFSVSILRDTQTVSRTLNQSCPSGLYHYSRFLTLHRSQRLIVWNVLGTRLVLLTLYGRVHVGILMFTVDWYLTVAHLWRVLQFEGVRIRK